MASPRASMCSHFSRNSTAVDPNSAFSTPQLAQGHIERGPCAEHDTCETLQTARSSLPNTHSGPYKYQNRYGWPLLAEIMADTPEFAAFPRYRDLNTRNLLYFKAQIDALQIRILEQEEEQGLQMERYDTIAKHHNPDKRKQNHVYHSLLMDMRELLADYNEALLRYSKVSALSDPEAHNMRSLTNVLSAGGRPVNVRGPEGRDTTWGDFPESTNSNWAGARAVVKALLTAKQPPKSNRDLVVTHQAAKIDGLTKWIVYWLMPFYWCMRDSYNSAKASSSAPIEMRPVTGVRADTEAQNNLPTASSNRPQYNLRTLESVSEETALRLTSGFSTIIACLIPVVAIAVLTQLHGTRDLLICITGFSTLFAAGLIFLTQGTSSRTEIFAATAAFSAVMVVFISQPIIQISPESNVSM